LELSEDARDQEKLQKKKPKFARCKFRLFRLRSQNKKTTIFISTDWWYLQWAKATIINNYLFERVSKRGAPATFRDSAWDQLQSYNTYIEKPNILIKNINKNFICKGLIMTNPGKNTTNYIYIALINNDI